MARLIKFPSNCYYCGVKCLKGQGYLQRVSGHWFAHCFDCYNKKKNAEKNSQQ